MKASHVIDILTQAAPREIEWSKGEPYGAFNIPAGLDVKKVLFCVTPTQEVCDHFKKSDYDLLISHHPYQRDVPQIILHTALDCCENGLNDQWRDALGVQDPKHFDGTLGWHGKIEPISFEALVKKCEKFMGHKVIGQTYSKLEVIRSVVICTGLGGLVTNEAKSSGAECYILGEAVAPAKQMGFPAVIETGHTISEQMGVVLIRKLLPEIQIDLAPLEIDYFGKETYSPRPD
jgi:putative NIF3 family GTP cyclohydrolase 1 type 2